MFALIYKTGMLLLRHASPTGKEQHYDAFLAGLVGGYAVFGRTIHQTMRCFLQSTAIFSP